MHATRTSTCPVYCHCVYTSGPHTTRTSTCPVYCHCVYTSGPHTTRTSTCPVYCHCVYMSGPGHPVPPGRPRDLSTVTVSTCQDRVTPYHQDVHVTCLLSLYTYQDPVPPGHPHGLSTVTLPTRQDPVPPRTA